MNRLLPITLSTLLFLTSLTSVAKEATKAFPIPENYWSKAEIAEKLARYRTWRDKQPTLPDLLEAAFAKFNLSLSRAEDLEKRAKRSALLPKLLVTSDTDLGSKSSVSIEDNVSVSSGEVTVGPDEASEDYTIDNGESITVKMQWDFAPLVYHSDLIAINRERRAIGTMRLSLIEKISELTRKRDDLAFRSFFARSPIEEAMLRSQVQGIEENLAGITGWTFLNQTEGL